MNSNVCTVSAPGKLMLFGEYAVLDGNPCIVTAVDRRITITLQTIKNHEFQLDASLVGIKNYAVPFEKIGTGEMPKGVKFVEVAVKNFFELSGMQDAIGLKIKTGGFPSQYGFGSSAAVTVCVIKGLSEIFQLNLSNQQIFNISYKTVLDIQGVGSGFDIASSIWGGTIYFVSGGKTIEHLSENKTSLIVGYSGQKADTSTAIRDVKERFKDKQMELFTIYSEIGKIVKEAKIALKNNDDKRAGLLMNKNQKLLDKLGVNTKKLNAMMKASIDGGSYGAKLSGAGMGDCMISICPPKNKLIVESLIENAGGEILHVKTNEEGVRIEL